MILGGCGKEEHNPVVENYPSSGIEVVLGSTIASRVQNNVWESGDHMGVFMFRTGESLSDASLINGTGNAKYTAEGGSSSFSPATENDRMFYPKGIAVDFIAYYPYTGISNYRIATDLTRQQNPSAIDLLYSDNLKGISATKEAQTLVFRHVFSRLAFVVEAGEGVDATELQNISILIRNIPVYASFDVSAGTLNPDASETKDVTAMADGTEASAIVYPGESAGRTVSVITPAREYTFSIATDSPNWETGYQYKYTLNLSHSVNTPTLKAEITPWKEVEGGGLDGSDEEVQVTPWDGQSSDTNWYEASDTEFQISTAAELNGLSELVRSGIDFTGKTVRLASRVNLNNHPFPSIGFDDTHAFAGTFDGGRHLISGFVPTLNAEERVAALFGFNKGTVRNVQVSGNAELDDDSHAIVIAGGIVAENRGTIEGCRNYLDMNVSSTRNATTSTSVYVGGIAGANLGTISQSQNYGEIEAAQSGAGTGKCLIFIGGISGTLQNGTVSGCENTQSVKATGYTVYAGGISGRTVTGKDAGSIASQIENCNNYGDITINGASKEGYAGGLMGNAYSVSNLRECMNEGAITVKTNTASALIAGGGIIGLAQSSQLSTSQNRGSVTATNTAEASKATAGGIVGKAESTVTIHTCTNSPEASAESGGVTGGIVGTAVTSTEDGKTAMVYGCCQNQGFPAKWIGSAPGTNHKAGVNMESHEDNE